MKTKFTKGNWAAHKNNSWSEEHKIAFGDKDGYVICFTERGHVSALASVIGMQFVPKEEIEANAKLIAAAPEMFKALLKISEWLLDDTCLPTDETMEGVWMALKNAADIEPPKH